MEKEVDIENLWSQVEEYIVEFVDSSTGRLPYAMQLKHEHTLRVLDNISIISRGDGFNSRLVNLSKVIAILHDIGRYNQLKKYGTFSDAKSIDHADLSWQISRESSWLYSLENADRELVLLAVKLHNKRELPVDLSGDGLLLAKAIRDADKIDILKIVEDSLKKPNWEEDSSIWFNKPIYLSPSKAILDSISKKETPSYTDIASCVDFILVQLAWIDYGMEFKTSKQICLDRRHFNFRVDFLKSILGEEEANEVMNAF